MKFKFLYDEWQEDEGFEIEMQPRIGLLEEREMSQKESFEAFMAGYFDFSIFLETQLAEVPYIERLEKRLAQAKQNGE